MFSEVRIKMPFSLEFVRSSLTIVALKTSMFTSDSVNSQTLGQAGDLNHLPLTER